uniref:Ankyrin repeat and SOCS box containing 4 n=1 Tax=Eptatretus burgeri TaxID=7764 RepID=A0A8C4WXK3_EPTBU
MDHVMLSPLERKTESKKVFLDAINSNNIQLVEDYLHEGTISVDELFMVEDEKMLLCAYKPGYWLPNYKLQSSWATPLHLATALGRPEISRLLLQYGASIESTSNGKTPLHVASSLARPELVTLLMEHGADLDAYSLSWMTPLHYCTFPKTLECARLLLEAGADINLESGHSTAETPLHVAARYGLADHVALYISYGAEIDIRNGDDETPLSTAIYWSLDLKMQWHKPEHHQVCELLLALGANPNATDGDYRCLFHKAAWNADIFLLQLLLSYGANINKMDGNGCMPLQYLLSVVPVRREFQPEACVQLMLNHGSQPINPLQFHKVLEACSHSPVVVEMTANCYKSLRITSLWKKAISPEHREEHKAFYDSLFHMCQSRPRSLLHLSRCCIRCTLATRCHSAIPQLPLPGRLKVYLLLQPEGVFY